MFPRWIQIVCGGTVIIGALQLAANGRCLLDLSRPACGKVCKLVCEKKTLTAIGYGDECKDICLPGPSQACCKYCACYCGKSKCEPGKCCQPSAPKFEFCWRDWFACGCGKPRTVKVLTKWQLEKKIHWYHWEVVDVSCCDCVGDANEVTDENLGIAESTASHSFYKAAPEIAEIGAVIPVSNEEWAKMSSTVTSDPENVDAEVVIGPAPETVITDAETSGDSIQPNQEPQSPSVAKQIGQFFK